MLKHKKIQGILIGFAFLLISLSIEIFNKNSNPDRYKVWTEDFVLKAEDFLGQPPFYGGRQAIISSRPRVITSPEIRVVIEMDKFQSYIKKNRISEKLIKHEAYHLKLAYAIFVEVNEKISQKNLSLDEANELTLNRYEYLKQYQKMYDRETNHSLIRAQQNYWEYKIDSMIYKANDFQLFQETEKIKVYFPNRPNEFVPNIDDKNFNGFLLEKYDVSFWIVDMEFLISDTRSIEGYMLNILFAEGQSDIIVNEDLPHEKAIFESISKDTIRNAIVIDKLLMGEKSTYWLRNSYPIVEENEEIYRRMGEQFFNSFKVLDK